MNARSRSRYPGAEDCTLEVRYELHDPSLMIIDVMDTPNEIVDLTDDNEEAANSGSVATDLSSSTNSCPIKRLFDKRLSWTDVERMEFIRNGKPHPIISNVIDGRPMDLNQFSNFQWLTGSNDLGQIFCWPCILFNRPGNPVWAKKDFSSMNTFMVAVRRHEMDLEHMEAVLRLNLAEIELEQELIVVEMDKVEEVKRQEQVMLFRSMIRQLTGIISLPKIGYCIDFVNCPATQGHFLNFLSSINGPFKTYQSVNKNLKDNLASFLVRSTPDLLQVVAHCARSQIRENLRKSSYVTLIIEDAAALVSESSYLSFVVRFVGSNSNIYEHFIRFVNVGEERTATNLLKHVQSILTELDSVKSLVGFTYDGAALSPDEIQTFNCGVKLISPRAVFFHYRSHSIQRMMMQAFSHCKCSKMFFEKLDKLYRFFKNIPKLLEMFLEMRKQTGQHVLPNLEFDNEFVVTLNQNYQIMTSCCQIVSQHPESWNHTTSDRARRCLIFLNDSHNKHTITLLANIVRSIRGFANIAATNNVMAWKGEAEKAISMLDQLTSHSAYEVKVNFDDTRFSAIRRELINCAKTFILERTRNVDDMIHYGHLMSFSSGGHFEREVQAHPLYENFLASNGFDSQAVIAQIGFVYSNQILAGKPIDQMLMALLENNLLEDFADLGDYLRLILTVPIQYVGAYEPTRDRIPLWFQTNNRAKDSTMDDSFLFIERKLVAELCRSEQFINSIIELFAAKTNRQEFIM